jgi:hypothetical protein
MGVESGLESLHDQNMSKILIFIVVEAAIVLGLGTIGSYLLWRLKKNRKLSFGEFVNQYGYAIGFILFLIIAMSIATFNTYIRD